MRLYAVRIDISEAATRYEYPVVTHIMYGKTKSEAWHYVESHRKTDRFLDACLRSSRFGEVQCRARISEGWVGRRSR